MLKIPIVKEFKLKQQNGEEFSCCVGDVGGCKSPEPYIHILEGFFIEDSTEFFDVIDQAKELYKKILTATDLLYECNDCGKISLKKDLIYSDTELWCTFCNHTNLKLKEIISVKFRRD